MAAIAASASARERLRPASYLQRRIAEHIAGRPYADNICRAWRLLGRLDTERLQAALGALARRHETLRTGLVTIDGVVAQRVVDDVPLRARVERLGRRRTLTSIVLEGAEACFDLAEPPLVRPVLVRISRDDHVLVVVAGHAVWDAISTGVFARDLFALYADAPDTLPELTAQFGELVARDEGVLDANALSYWGRRFTGASLLAPDRMTRPEAAAQPAVAWARHAGPTPAFARRLAAISRRERSTLGIALMAGYAAAVAQVCDVDRLTFALLHANRDSPERQPLIGYCVDAMLVPVAVEYRSTFRELVRDTTERVFDDYAWRVPVGAQVQLVTAGVERPPAMHELIFNPVAGLGASATPRVPGLEIIPLVTPKRGYSRDAAWPRATLLVTINGTPTGGMAIDAEYDPHVLSRAEVANVARTLTALIELGAARPDATLGQLGARARRRSRLLAATTPPPGWRGWSRG
jgi:hypothetical protein